MSLSRVSLFVCYHAEFHYAECNYAECRCAECRSAECRGALFDLRCAFIGLQFSATNGTKKDDRKEHLKNAEK